MPTIVLVNKSTVLTDAEIDAVIPALQQNATDFCNVWRSVQDFPANATILANNDPAPEAWPLYIYDHTDIPGAGGYHDDDLMKVQGKVFAADAMEHNEAWTVDASHEMLEMLGDPLTTKIIKVPGLRLEWFAEVCDPVEADSFGYKVGDVLVSDFVLPSYSKSIPLGHFDFTGALKGPCPDLTHGGYITLYDPKTRQFHQRFADHLSRRAMNSHRAHRRLVP